MKCPDLHSEYSGYNLDRHWHPGRRAAASASNSLARDAAVTVRLVPTWPGISHVEPTAGLSRGPQYNGVSGSASRLCCQ